ncbi:CotH kinase family protein, partial [Flavobacterium sp.]
MKKKLLLATIFLLLFSKNMFSQQVVINEVVSSNGTLIVDEDNSYQDWIEIYNNSANPITLTGYGLTDDANLPFKWVFPNVTINSGGYLLVWASDKNRINPTNQLHTNFKISASGEAILLTNPIGVVLDTAPATALLSNQSVGRIPNGTGSFVVIQTPTPNAENTDGAPILTLNPPTFSQNSGFLTSSFNLSLTTNEPGVTIIYTLDGSEPDENNLLGTTYSYKNQYPQNPGQAFGTFLNQSFQTLQYSAPINIIDRSSQPNKIANISSTYDFSPPYFPNNPIFKGTVVRAKAIKSGATSSEVITKTYFVAPTGASTFSLPVVAISTSENRLFDYDDGIYVAGKDFDTWRTSNPTDIADYEIGNFARKGGSSERVANFSYFVNGNEVLNQDIGIRIRGNYSRIYPSKSFNLYARSELGKSDFDYPVFPNQPYQEYTRMSLKNSSGDFYHTMFRDPLNHELIKGMRVDTEAYQPTITFLNGEYWGILSLREKYDDKYFKRVYNIESNELDVLENNAQEEEGDNIHYLQMIDYVENNSLAQTVNYDYIKTQMDVENFEDYFISNIYLQNVDWPGNNIIYWRKKTAQYEPNAPYGQDGRWRWSIHDMDSSFGISSGVIDLNSLEMATALNGPEWPNPEWSTLLLRKLLENDTFKIDFISRFADLMNSYFKSERVVAKINEMKTVLEPEMPKQFERWKAPEDFGDWNYFLNEEIDFAQQRPGFQRDHIRTKFGIGNNINTIIDVSNAEHGYVKINTIDVLVSTPGINENPYPWTGIYFSDIPIKLKAVGLPGYIFSHWEGFSTSLEAEITVSSSQSFSITAVFIKDGFVQETEEPIYFWMFTGTIANDTPLTFINSTFEIPTEGVLQYQSCLAGYPFTNADPKWRKGSMERKNSPTILNYIPEANNDIPFATAGMRGIQIKQPFQNNGLENTLIFNFSTGNYKDIKFGFAAKNDSAAEGLLIDYSVSAGAPTWITTGLASSTLPLTSAFELFEVDFSAITAVNNNSNFKIRLRFSGLNMTLDLGKSVQFNNFSLKGTKIPLLYTTPNVFAINQTISSLIPTLSATANSFAIVPSLPIGLDFDTTTGIIAGTPTQLSTATNYTVSASNSGGTTSFVLSIAV